jgi:hypothetical protein
VAKVIGAGEGRRGERFGILDSGRWLLEKARFGRPEMTRQKRRAAFLPRAISGKYVAVAILGTHGSWLAGG